MTTLPTTVRDSAVTLSTDLAQADGADNHGGQGDGNDCGGDSHHGNRPVPSFWKFAEDENNHDDFGGRGRNQFKLMRYHA